MGNYRLTLLAKSDLREIIIYTLETWSKTQAEKYVGTLKSCFNELHKDDFLSRRVFNNVYVTLCEHHYIFYLKENPALIIAIFHEKMDLITRLKNRLDT